jgi:hypothetical protein
MGSRYEGSVVEMFREKSLRCRIAVAHREASGEKVETDFFARRSERRPNVYSARIAKVRLSPTLREQGKTLIFFGAVPPSRGPRPA